MGDATADTLVRRYQDYCDYEGYLIEDKISNGIALKGGGIVEVFRLIGATSRRFARSAFTYDMAKTILTKKGHFLLVATRNDKDKIGHTRVVYGVGVPDEANFSAFNPNQNVQERPSGYENIPFRDSNSDNGFLYPGWAGWAGPSL